MLTQASQSMEFSTYLYKLLSTQLPLKSSIITGVQGFRGVPGDLHLALRANDGET